MRCSTPCEVDYDRVGRDLEPSNMKTVAYSTESHNDVGVADMPSLLTPNAICIVVDAHLCPCVLLSKTILLDKSGSKLL